MSSSPTFRSPKAGVDVEERIARELQRQKVEQEAKRREVDRILSESEDLRYFKSKIQAAYINKERSAQIVDGHLRKLNDIVSSLMKFPLFIYLSLYRKEMQSWRI